jgi:hypothetical protein
MFNSEKTSIMSRDSKELINMKSFTYNKAK